MTAKESWQLEIKDDASDSGKAQVTERLGGHSRHLDVPLLLQVWCQG